MTILDCAVVGAGLAGLGAARRLTDAGLRITLFEREAKPGGRLASHNAHGSDFDRGAQYFTVREPRFARHVEQWFSEGLIAPWTGRLAQWRDGHIVPKHEALVRYVGIPSMAALPNALAAKLEIRYGTEIHQVKRHNEHWQLLSNEGQLLAEAKRLLLALPAPVAQALLGAAQQLTPSLQIVVMQPCWTLMLDLRDRLELLADGVFIDEGPLSWIARNGSKPGRNGETWVCHASAAWSHANRSKPAEAIIPELGAAFARIVNDIVRPRYAEACYWPYARATTPLEGRFVLDAERQLALAGDWCGGTRVEDAFLSGLEAAEALISERPSTRAVQLPV